MIHSHWASRAKGLFPVCWNLKIQGVVEGRVNVENEYRAEIEVRTIADSNIDLQLEVTGFWKC
jgi:hypothetical protein